MTILQYNSMFFVFEFYIMETLRRLSQYSESGARQLLQRDTFLLRLLGVDRFLECPSRLV